MFCGTDGSESGSCYFLVSPPESLLKSLFCFIFFSADINVVLSNCQQSVDCTSNGPVLQCWCGCSEENLLRTSPVRQLISCVRRSRTGRLARPAAATVGGSAEALMKRRQKQMQTEVISCSNRIEQIRLRGGCWWTNVSALHNQSEDLSDFLPFLLKLL